jgi:subtilase family serine protease
LEPKIAELVIAWTPNLARTYHLKAIVDPEDAIQEIYGLNNAVEFRLRVGP